MPTDKRPLKVFLSHSHSDAKAVRAIYNRLTADGVDAWLDKEKLLPGQDWELEIRKAVREADVVVVCLSKQFKQAGYRQKEVRWALDAAMEKPEGEIFIIPARLEECENLESLRKWHWVDLFENDGYEKLIQALQIRSENIGTKLEIRSREYSDMASEIIVPVSTTVEHLMEYLNKFLLRGGNYLGGFMIETRDNIRLEQKGKEVYLPENKEKIGVFSISPLSPSRSKLWIVRSYKGEEFKNLILELMRQLQEDSLIDGVVRGILNYTFDNQRNSHTRDVTP